MRCAAIMDFYGRFEHFLAAPSISRLGRTKFRKEKRETRQCFPQLSSTLPIRKHHLSCDTLKMEARSATCYKRGHIATSLVSLVPQLILGIDGLDIRIP